MLIVECSAFEHLIRLCHLALDDGRITLEIDRDVMSALYHISNLQPVRLLLPSDRNALSMTKEFSMQARQSFFRWGRGVTFILCASLIVCTQAFSQSDPLPSWNDTAPKKAIVTFVEQVTREGSPNFISVAQRIATFDNDGTLWAEQPMYFQILFALDRVKALAPQHPEWKPRSHSPRC